MENSGRTHGVRWSLLEEILMPAGDFAGQGVRLRAVRLEDASFILELRAGAAAQGGLHHGAVTDNEQREWLRSYFVRHQQGLEYYFIVEYGLVAVGAVRIYNIDHAKESFTWGSWVMKKGTEAAAAWLSAIAVYDFAFDALKLKTAQFEVVAKNQNVIRFHRAFGADCVNETSEAVAFMLTADKFRSIRGRFLRLVGSSIPPSDRETQ